MNPVEYAQGIEGWMRPEELTWLSCTAAALKPGAVWLEVGTWKGKSWSCAALSLSMLSQIIAVDTFDGGEYDGESRQYFKEKGSVLRDFLKIQDAVHKARPDLLTRTITKPSVKAAELIPDGSCDVIFIDGDHRTEAVLADVKAWTPKLKPHGLLCGHDADDPMVMAALAEVPLDRMDQSVRGSIWCRTRS